MTTLVGAVVAVAFALGTVASGLTLLVNVDRSTLTSAAGTWVADMKPRGRRALAGAGFALIIWGLWGLVLTLRSVATWI